LRIKKHGKLVFTTNMVVFHQKKTWTIKRYFRYDKRIISRIYLIKDYQDTNEKFWKIVAPRKLLLLVFPPLILVTLIRNKFRTWNDFKLIPFIYFRSAHMRYLIWKTAIKERILLL
jgi:hypothetical protein